MTYTSLHRTAPRRLAGLARVTALAAALLTAVAVFAADPVKKSFNLPAGDAAETLKQFSEQSGEQIIYPAAQARGVKTKLVQGDFSPREALERMLADTVLIVTQDEKTGALAVAKSSSPNAERAAPAGKGDRPGAKVENGTVKLDEVEVFGTRIRQTDAVGPSPVKIYDTDSIRSTGALNLADFLRSLPQTYGGVGAGRNSAPNDLNMAAGQRNESLLPLTPGVGSSPILANNAPVQSGVSGVSLRGLGSGSTLVLVDGRRVAQSGNANRGSSTGQGFVDLNTIPLGLIERIEVITDGASAIYGADAVAGVINVVLKKSWSGSEASVNTKITEHGGGGELQASYIVGFAKGKLRGTVAIDHYERDPLLASDRAFSKNMDFRNRLVGYNATGAAVYGSDQRIQWGYPASIQATATTGFVSIPGVRVLLTPTGYATTPPLSAFIQRTTNADNQPATLTAIIAQGQRTFDPAPYVELVAGSTRDGFTGNFNYGVTSRIELYGSASLTKSRGAANTLPAYAGLVAIPANVNPFGEAIQIGLMLPKWGQIWQKTRTETSTGTIGVRGELGQTWRWDTGFRRQIQEYNQINKNFNATAFTAIATATDPAQRYNPFIDERVAGAPDQSGLLKLTEIYPTVESKSALSTVDFSANGNLYTLWGGSIRAAFGGAYESDSSFIRSIAQSGYPVVSTITSYTDKRTTKSGFSELSVPLFGKPNSLPLLRRLEANVAGRYEKFSDTSTSSRVPKYGVTWAPFKSLLFRASYSEGFRAPSLTEDRRATSTSTSTVTDPRRGNVATPNVTVIGRSNPDLKPETSKNEFLGVVFEPDMIKGLNLQVNFYRTRQKNAIQSFGTTTILNNESLFPGFVIRGDPTAADIASGYPGQVLTVYSQYGNFGLIENESVDYLADYTLPWERFGRWRVSVNVARTLTATRQLVIGGPVLNDLGDTLAGPKWNGTASVFWNKGGLTASATVSHMDGYNTNQGAIIPNSLPTPAVSKVDLRASYEFENGIWRGYGKGLRAGLGISNLFDKEPPFFNNIYGFNGGLHGQYAFGRTYELSFVFPITR
ncbi:MAG: TonB-dependent receptor [Opitutaceae bacterium]